MASAAWAVFSAQSHGEGKLVEVAGSDYEVESKLVVSSIGSVPEPLPDVPRKGELYDFADAS